MRRPIKMCNGCSYPGPEKRCYNGPKCPHSKKLLTHWECFIDDISSDGIHAHCKELDEEYCKELMIIPLETIPIEERGFVRRGAIFELKTYMSGEIEIVFRKKQWTKEDMNRIKKEAEELAKTLNKGTIS